MHLGGQRGRRQSDGPPRADLERAHIDRRAEIGVLLDDREVAQTVERLDCTVEQLDDDRESAQPPTSRLLRVPREPLELVADEQRIAVHARGEQLDGHPRIRELERLGQCGETLRRSPRERERVVSNELTAERLNRVEDLERALLRGQTKPPRSAARRPLRLAPLHRARRIVHALNCPGQLGVADRRLLAAPADRHRPGRRLRRRRRRLALQRSRQRRPAIDELGGRGRTASARDGLRIAGDLEPIRGDTNERLELVAHLVCERLSVRAGRGTGEQAQTLSRRDEPLQRRVEPRPLEFERARQREGIRLGLEPGRRARQSITRRPHRRCERRRMIGRARQPPSEMLPRLAGLGVRGRRTVNLRPQRLRLRPRPLSVEEQDLEMPARLNSSAAGS